MDTSSADSTSTSVASGVVTGLATICVALRFYVRIRTKIGLGWDDWMILIGLLTTLLSGALLLWGNQVDPSGGIAVDNDSPTFDYTPHILYLKLSFITSILYFTLITAIKLSILHLYHRIFSVDPSFRRQSISIGIVVCLFWLATTIATLVNCIPLEYSWIGLSDPAHCFNYNIFWMVTGALEVVIDTIILVLPVRMVLGLQLSPKRKILLLFIFLLGGFVIITGIIRVIYGYKPGSRVPSYSKTELWSAIHIGTAMICACLPTLRPLFFRGFFTSTPSSSTAFSSLRRGYNGFRGWYRKGISTSTGSRGSRNGDLIEEYPLRQQDNASSTIQDPHAETVWLTDDRDG